MDYSELRDRYKTFRYTDYEYTIDGGMLHAIFHFTIDGLESFSPEWKIPASYYRDEADERSEISRNTAEIIDRLVFSLGMVELVSYWKITCAPTVLIECGQLTEFQAEWWKKLYWGGLGEFFYVNKIDADHADFMSIHNAEKTSVVRNWDNTEPVKISGDFSGCLVPIGGGKDSAVSLEVLRTTGEDVVTYTVNGIKAARATIDICDYKSGDISAARTLDKNMLELNKKGYLNGHTPFSAIVAFSSYIAAFLNGRKYITLSNESSANESTVAGSSVNHQYSKSYEFEHDFMAYIGTIIKDSPILYFSLLRPLSELQITCIFAKQKRYHGIFRSCNRGSKTGVWCCECPKCLFVYIMLSAFLSQQEMIEIFGEDLLNKASLKEYFRELAGIAENKPFECVGTRREVVLAINHCQYEETPLLIRENPVTQDKKFDEALHEWNDENNVPEKFLDAVRRKLVECRII